MEWLEFILYIQRIEGHSEVNIPKYLGNTEVEYSLIQLLSNKTETSICCIHFPHLVSQRGKCMHPIITSKDLYREFRRMRTMLMMLNLFPR